MFDAQIRPTFTHDFFFTVPPVWADGCEPELYAVCYGEFVSRGGFIWDNPPEDSWRIHWIEEGEGRIGVNNGKPAPLRAGDVYVMRPGSSYHREDSKRKPWRYRWLMVRGKRVTEALDRAGLPTDKVLTRPGMLARAEPVFEMMRRALAAESPSLMSLCGLAHVCLDACAADGPGAVKPAKTEGHRATLAAEWLRQHYARGVTVEDAAKAMGMSRSGLFRVFREHTGQNPKAYLDHLRIEHARHLLHRGGYTVKEIASRCGFSDARHFSRTFTRKTGEQPSDFREGE
jgi:AraC family transcriptional regulator of arabinose operon